jgi:hypothetical protein
MDKPFPKILYRGVDKAHPAYPQALQGIAPARGNLRNPRYHNEISTENSIYLSFSSLLIVAAEHATAISGEGIILELDTTKAKNPVIDSPDACFEAEWLVEDSVTNLKPIFFVKLVRTSNGRNQYEFFDFAP